MNADMKHTIIGCTLIIALFLGCIVISMISLTNRVVEHVDNIADAVHYTNVTISADDKED